MSYSQHEEFAKQLAARVKALAEIIAAEPELHEPARVLSEQAKRIEADRLTVVIAGDFNRGKSTLLNAFLGLDVLPQKAVPSTAVVTQIIYGPPSVRVFFNAHVHCTHCHKKLYFSQDSQGKSVRCRGCNLVFTAGHVVAAPPAESLDLVEFKKRYVLSPEDHRGKDQASTDRFSEVDYAELSYEIELCRHRVQLVDSPGLNDDVIRTDRTRDFLKKADAVVMVLDATTPVTQAETEFIEMVRDELRQSNIFFVINKWNLLKEMISDPAEYPEIEARFRQKLGEYCVVEGADRYDHRIYRVNAKLACECRKNKPVDKEALASSGVPALETGLERFLTEERGALRARSVLGDAQMTCDRVTKYVRTRRANLDDSFEELESKAKALAPQLERLRRVRKHIAEFLKGRSLKLQNFILDSLRQHLSKADIPGAVEQFDLSEITGRWLAGRAIIDKVLLRAEENRLEATIERQLRPQAEKFIKDQIAEWRKNIVTPGMKVEAVELMGYLRAEADEYRQILAEIERLTGEEVTEPMPVDEIVKHWLSQSMLEGDLVDRLTPSEGLGVAIDMAPLFASIAAEILLHLKGALVPVIGTIVALGLSLWRQKSMVDKMKATIVSGLIAAVQKIPDPEQSAVVRNRVDTSFRELEQKVTMSINQDIADREAALHAALEHKKSVKFDADKERTHLDALEQQVQVEMQKLQTLCLRRPVGSA